jgi:hypothetical protein
MTLPYAAESRTREPSVRGHLRDRPYEHLLAYVENRQLTGTLELSAGGVVQSVVSFTNGLATRAHTRSPLYLSTILLELGHIDATAHTQALQAISSTSGLFGDEVVKRGHCTREAVDDALSEQLTRKLVMSFALPESTEFAYYNRVDLLQSMSGSGIRQPVGPSVVRGIRTKGTTPKLKEALERIGTERYLSLLSSNDIDPLRSVDGLGLTEEEATVARSCTEPVSLALLRARHGPKVADRTVYVLVVLRRLRVGGAASSGKIAITNEASLSFRVATANLSPATPSGSGERAKVELEIPVTHDPDEEPISTAGPLSDRWAPLARARAFANRGEFEKGLRVLDDVRAQMSTPDPGVECLYAWVLANAHPDAETSQRARACLTRVLDRDARYAQAFYYLALLEKRDRKLSNALWLFEKAVEADPAHIDALRELRLFQVRGERAANEIDEAPASTTLRTALAGIVQRLVQK